MNNPVIKLKNVEKDKKMWARPREDEPNFLNLPENCIYYALRRLGLPLEEELVVAPEVEKFMSHFEVVQHLEEAQAVVVIGPWYDRQTVSHVAVLDKNRPGWVDQTCLDVGGREQHLPLWAALEPFRPNGPQPADEIVYVRVARKPQTKT